ncbi:Clavaminate synthase-like protein [Boletus edulis BED1]|uniref:JmjC domain-containing histone demethylation protein 1 n=1 Tax=Boletus edulis BED1 TaxID=1328754 RepID=A0AAD4GC75_BOLED|nr:Clavaminate synthase-like protein [Boletus edulis BED1]
MARSKRRTTRLNPQKSRERSPQLEPLSPLSARSSLTPVPVLDEQPGPPEQAPEEAQELVQEAPVQPALVASEEDTCPACKDGPADQQSTVSKESWIRCDACKSWYHWACAGNGADVDTIDKWYCKSCVLEKPSRTITFKPPARKSARKRAQPDYVNLNAGVEADPSRWLRVIQSKPIKDDEFRRMNGSDVGLEWLEIDENAMKEPIVIENPEGLGMKMPDTNFTVSDVADMVGHETPVEVIDVATQSNTPGWTLGKWTEYYNKEPSTRDKVRNVISLEISGTLLADRVLPPRLVRELDWVDRFWPSTRRGKGQAYPKVQLYCLMGVASAWTDWHVDFAGSSVYYHILRGSKVFYFIRPTPANLAAYERWSGTELQSSIWLGDMVDEVVKVTLYPGNTMIIPTGWIHAVHTPVDSLVFGGNFLHSYNVATQLKVVEIEKTTRVPKKFRFPYFTKLCWYVADKYLRDIKAKEEFSPRVLESLEALCSYLVSEVRAMERGSEAAKRDAKEHVPTDRIKDAPALARELRWRVRLAAGTTSDDEGNERPLKKALTNGSASVNGGVKRKRSPMEMQGPETETSLGRVQFRNFQPKGWDVVEDLPKEEETTTVQAVYPEEVVGLQQRWVKWDDGTSGEDGGRQALVERKREITVRARKIDGGLERQRIERVFERWEWSRVSDEESVEKGDVEMKLEDDKEEEVTKKSQDGATDGMELVG